MKCPGDDCGNVGSSRYDVEDTEMETCNVCGLEFYPQDSVEKYGDEKANESE